MLHRKESQELNNQLAAQHEKVASWKSKQNSEDIEQLNSERMIEKQIKLKLVCVENICLPMLCIDILVWVLFVRCNIHMYLIFKDAIMFVKVVEKSKKKAILQNL